MACLLQAGCAPSNLPGEDAFETPPPEVSGGTTDGSVSPAEEARPTPQATPVRFVFPTPGLGPVSAWRPPPYPAPWALLARDHFLFARPIPSGNVNWAHPLYRYGNTYFGEQSVHTGIDLGADRGTPVLAAGPGEVVWAGYGLYRGSYDPNDPYGLAVAIRHDFGYQDQPLYTVYAHLAEVWVWMGQRVETGEEIGVVGETGHASGPHLHFEVRLGENRYFATRNPELWMVPPEGWGVLAGRVLGLDGVPLREYPIAVRSLETGRLWEVWTYAAATVHPDSVLRENFVLGDLPAGPYEISIELHDRCYSASLLVRPGQTNYIVFRGRRGFAVEPTPTPQDLDTPPG
jgi:murein DD-endopeptidase MepM/ murein hydrolase activator NlpD